MRTAIRTDEAMAVVFTASGIPTSDQTVHPGIITIGRWWTDRDSGIQAARDLEETEGGFLLEPRDGGLEFQDNQYRLRGERRTSQITYKDTLQEIQAEKIQPEEPLRDLANIIRVNVRHYTTESSQRLWELREVLQIVAGDTYEIIARYPNPSTMNNEHIGVDTWSAPTYTVTDEADPASADRSSDISVTVVPGANEADITLENTSNSALFVQTLTLDGTPVSEVDPSTIEVRNEDSIDLYGEHDYAVPAKWLENINDARNYATQLVQLHKDPQLRVRVTVRANISPAALMDAQQRQISDRVTLEARGITGLFISQEYYVEAINHIIGKGRTHYYTLLLAPINPFLENVIRLDIGPGLGTGVLGR